MKFELEPYNRNVPDNDLIADIQRVAAQQGCVTVTMEQYRDRGRFGAETLCGDWNFGKSSLEPRAKEEIDDNPVR
jgi:hypothetical protein